jgi:hypothetical protein
MYALNGEMGYITMILEREEKKRDNVHNKNRANIKLHHA